MIANEPIPALSAHRIVITEDDNGDADHIDALLDGSTEASAFWVRPRPSAPGEYLAAVKSIHRVPSKSILKTASTSTTNSERKNSVNGLSRRGSAGSDSTSRSFLNLSLGGSSRGGGGGGTAFGSRRRFNAASNLAAEDSWVGVGVGCGVGLDLDGSLSSSRHDGSSGRVRQSSFLPAYLDDDGGEEPPLMEESSASRASLNVSDNGGGSSMRRNSVSFHCVDIREYDRTIGDNPSCRSGPPISLDWSYSQKSAPVPLEEYELERSLNRIGSEKELRLNKLKRRQMLSFQWGHSEEEMKLARKDTKKAQHRRTVTNHLRPVHMICDALRGRFSGRKKKEKKKKKDGMDGEDTLTDSSSTRPRLVAIHATAVGSGVPP